MQASSTPATIAPAAGLLSGAGKSDTLSSLFKLDGLRWMEYRSTTLRDGVTMYMTFRTDFLSDEMHEGTMQKHMRINVTITEPGNAPAITIDGWFDLADGEPSGDGAAGTNYMYSDAVLVKAGSETLTVPAGTFACTKYTISDNGTTGTFWHSPQAPVPVKFFVISDEQTQTNELKAWA